MEQNVFIHFVRPEHVGMYFGFVNVDALYRTIIMSHERSDLHLQYLALHPVNSVRH